jgi:endonuclease/exonuclease/phosphatase family metal-dependent hydrolase
MRLMTYNIRGGLGVDGRRSIRRIGDVVQGATADLVGLQEVHQRLPQSGLADQPRVLAQVTGMTCLFGPALSLGFGRYGNAVLCHGPARRRQVHRLPGEGEPRAALEVEVTMMGRALTLFCTHLGLSASARLAQAESLAAAVRRAGGPVVVVGDLNAGPNAEEVQMLLAAGLRHAAPPIEPTFPSRGPRHRIDYILVSAELASGECQVLPGHASDHLPVMTELRWSERE